MKHLLDLPHLPRVSRRLRSARYTRQIDVALVSMWIAGISTTI